MEVRYYDRNQLYQKVWEEPVKKVAARYGISGVALAKTCRKLRVPLPGRGYWAKHKVGKAPKRPPLPKMENPPKVLRHSFQKVEREKQSEPERLRPDVYEMTEQLTQAELLPETSDTLHPLVENLHPRHKKRKTGAYTSWYGHSDKPRKQTYLGIRNSCCPQDGVQLMTPGVKSDASLDGLSDQLYLVLLELLFRHVSYLRIGLHLHRDDCISQAVEDVALGERPRLGSAVEDDGLRLMGGHDGLKRLVRMRGNWYGAAPTVLWKLDAVSLFPGMLDDDVVLVHVFHQKPPGLADAGTSTEGKKMHGVDPMVLERTGLHKPFLDLIISENTTFVPANAQELNSLRRVVSEHSVTNRTVQWATQGLKDLVPRLWCELLLLLDREYPGVDLCCSEVRYVRLAPAGEDVVLGVCLCNVECAVGDRLAPSPSTSGVGSLPVPEPIGEHFQSLSLLRLGADPPHLHLGPANGRRARCLPGLPFLEGTAGCLIHESDVENRQPLSGSSFNDVVRMVPGLLAHESLFFGQRES